MQLRFRDLISDTVNEYLRMENFCRIFPARNSKLYDKFFSGNRALAKVTYRVLHTAEIVPYGAIYGNGTGGARSTLGQLAPPMRMPSSDDTL